MNSKSRIRQQLSAYLDGELGQAEATRVQQAVRSDAELAGELAELTATRDLLRRLPVQRAEEDFAARVLAEAERKRLVGAAQGEGSPSPLRWIRYLAAAAVLLVAASVGTIICITLLWPPDFEGHLAYHSAPRSGPAPVADNGRDALRAEAGGGETSARADAGDGLARLSGKSGEGLARFGKGSGAAPADAKARFAKDLGGVGDMGLAIARAVESNEVIFTDRLEATQRQVEKVLVANGIQPAYIPAEEYSAKKEAAQTSRANFYRANQVSPKTVEIEVFVTPEQMTTVQKELDTLRANQSVSQVAAGPPMGLEPARREADKLAEKPAPRPGEGGAGLSGVLALPAKGPSPAPAAKPAPAAPQSVPAVTEPTPAEVQRPGETEKVREDAEPRQQRQPSRLAKSLAGGAERPGGEPAKMARLPSTSQADQRVAQAPRPPSRLESVESVAKPKVVSTPAPMEAANEADGDQQVADARATAAARLKGYETGASSRAVAQTTAPAASEDFTALTATRPPVGMGQAGAPAEESASSAPQRPAAPTVAPQQTVVAGTMGEDRQAGRDISQAAGQSAAQAEGELRTAAPTTRPAGQIASASMRGRGRRGGQDQGAPEVGAKDQLVQVAQAEMRQLFDRAGQGQQATTQARRAEPPATQAVQAKAFGTQAVSQQAARLQKLRITLNYRDLAEPPRAAAELRQAPPDNAAKK